MVNSTHGRWPVLYVKTAVGATNFWQVWTEDGEIVTRWGQIDGQEQTNRTPATGKNAGRANATTAAEQAVKEAEAKYQRQLRLKYVTSTEEAKTGINIKPMRAYSLDEKRAKKLVFPVTAQPKYDGCRCMAYPLADGFVRLMSRGGLDYTLPHIQDQLAGRIPAGWCLDGELYVHGMSLQTIRHYIETPTEKTYQVKYVCYDMTQLPTTDLDWSARFLILYDWYMKNRDLPHLAVAPSLAVDSHEDLRLLHDGWVEDGYEGLMVRLPDGKYRLAAKSSHLLKMKRFDDEEFTVLAWSLGKDGIIQYTCEQEDGLHFEARPVGTAEERQTLLIEAQTGQAVGRKLTVRFMGRSDSKIPLHPRAIGFRPAKDQDPEDA